MLRMMLTFYRIFPVSLLMLGCAHTSPPALPAPTAEMAITFDDLPAMGGRPAGRPGGRALAKELHDILQRHGIAKVHGFAVGSRIESHPRTEGILLEWTSLGFTLGNHSYSHIGLSQMPFEEYVRDLERNETLLDRFRPVPETRWFRIPNADTGRNPDTALQLQRALAEHHIRPAWFTLYFNDFEWNNAERRCSKSGDTSSLGKIPQAYLDAALSDLRFQQALARESLGRDVKHVLMLHFMPLTARMLDALLTTFEKAGVRFISMEEALQDPVYVAPPAHVHRGGKYSFLLETGKARGFRFSRQEPPADAPDPFSFCK